MKREPVLHGWIFFDASCGMCSTLRQRWATAVETRGFRLAPLQDPWVQRQLGLHGEIPEEMKLLTPAGIVLGGADAFVYIAKFVWWAWPLWLLGHVPLGMTLLRILYRPIAKHRHRISRVCRLNARAAPMPQIEKWLD